LPFVCSVGVSYCDLVRAFLIKDFHSARNKDLFPQLLPIRREEDRKYIDKQSTGTITQLPATLWINAANGLLFLSFIINNGPNTAAALVTTAARLPVA
jgi:hypothetical protein